MKALTGACLLVVVAFMVAACGSLQRVKATSGSYVMSEYSLHVGQTRTLGHLRPGDTVACLGRADTVSVRVPRPSIGATYANTWDKRLSLELGPVSHGRATAHCSPR
jgi:hypothetical protein